MDWLKKNGLASDLLCLCLFWWTFINFYQYFSIQVVYNKFFLSIWVLHQHNFFLLSCLLLTYHSGYCWEKQTNKQKLVSQSVLETLYCNKNMRRQADMYTGCRVLIFLDFFCYLICYYFEIYFTTSWIIPKDLHMYVKWMKINQDCNFMAAEQWCFMIMCRSKVRNSICMVVEELLKFFIEKLKKQ